MTPTLPERIDDELEQLCWAVSNESSELGAGVPSGLLNSLAEFLEIINSFYTNSMEGNPSRLKDIENALKKSFEKDKGKRNFQLEHLAHIETQKLMLGRVAAETELVISTPEFIQWIHHEFYSRLPEEMRYALTQSGDKVPLVPGAIRNRGVVVGSHSDGPETLAQILDFMKLFAESYDPSHLTPKMRMVAMAASHHRLLWVHPFPDGNGRVARLFTTAFMNKIGISSNNLWTINRYFGRNRRDYDGCLEMADRPRRNSYDGRGPLSEEDLVAFCKFFLNGCLDQIRFMKQSLSLNNFLKPKFKIFLLTKVQSGEVSKSVAEVLENIVATGEIARGDVKKICKVKQRRATEIVKELLDSGLASSPSAYGPLRLKFTSEMIPFLFPGLA